MRRSEHPDARPGSSGRLAVDALVVCPACGARVEDVQAWEILRFDGMGICQRPSLREAWYEMGPCGCEVEQFVWRTGVLEAAARETTGRHLPAPKGELTP